MTAWSALGFGLPGNCPLRQTGLSTTGYNATSRRKRSKEIIWFSPLFSQNFKTSIGNLTFTVVIKNFARNHKFKETFNTLKLSYSSSSNKGQLDIYGAKYSKMGQNKFVEDRHKKNWSDMVYRADNLNSNFIKAVFHNFTWSILEYFSPYATWLESLTNKRKVHLFFL